MTGDMFAPGAALPDARIEKNVRGATSPLLAALERAKIAVGAARAHHEHALQVVQHSDGNQAVSLRRTKNYEDADDLLHRTESAYASAVEACYEAGVLAPPVAAVEDAEAALRFALDEVAKRASAKPNAMPGGRP